MDLVNADLKTLDKVVKETTRAVEKGKEQIFAIAESARKEGLRVRNELKEIKELTAQIILEVDELERKEKLARARLATVSQNFDKFSEDDIREAYDQAQELQVKLNVLREREYQLRKKRDDLELSLRNLDETTKKAEELVSTVGVVLDFLAGNLQNINSKIESLKNQQQIGFQIIKAQEEERKRVAREIHDGPAQSMANVVLRMEFCEKLFDVDLDKVKAEIKDLKEVVRNNLQDVRKIIFDLRPMALDDLGLVPALKNYIEDYQEKYKIPVEFVFFGRESRLENTLEIALFRLIQEALSNVRKHAQASMVSVRLEIGPKNITAVIKDNGKGFNVNEVINNKQRESFGLIGMKERVEILEGEIEIKSFPGKGTEILIKVPLK